MLTRGRGLYRSINDVEAKYYADGEDAFDMRKQLQPKKGGAHRLPKPTIEPALPVPRTQHGAPERLEGSQAAEVMTPSPSFPHEGHCGFDAIPKYGGATSY